MTPATQRKVLLVLAQADRAVGAGLYGCLVSRVAILHLQKELKKQCI